MLLKHSAVQRLALSMGISMLLASSPVTANGPIGDHVNQLQTHLPTYAQEVDWLIGKVDGMVGTYEAKGKGGVNSEELIEHWEAVDFHAAIETNYVPVYALIWQSLFGVKDGIAKEKPVAVIRQEQQKLEQSLWQALGAVKLAAQYQQQGKLAKRGNDNQLTEPNQILAEIKHRLDRVVAKAAEKLPQQATDIVHNTYLNLFEGLEGRLIAEDAELVESLEKDFNVTLPLALKNQSDVEEIRKVVSTMQVKLDKASTLLQQAQSQSRDVF
ncbi:hypothetical protein [Lacimicrobium alkaliphilum]|uniref:Imelysin-like domain-containing protein n=1 Tax=Lacimicrobium alkaliphilum TaxID=1526571 RepID=A0ABQ1R315_9ALTE|nr:hypothetical protein [Lacimicrobium alkaliphilum]GGD52877.1 hypothetical protein GCM10011357_05930 [Lacimicrobium alkaliphilum]